MYVCKGEGFKGRIGVSYWTVTEILELYEAEWKLNSNNPKASYNESNIPEKLLSEEDIKLLHKYCIQEINDLCIKYSTGSFTAADYGQLARLCLASELTFNARRGG